MQSVFLVDNLKFYGSNSKVKMNFNSYANWSIKCHLKLSDIKSEYVCDMHSAYYTHICFTAFHRMRFAFYASVQNRF